jgi:putative FmdB family regulatory protein
MRCSGVAVTMPLLDVLPCNISVQRLARFVQAKQGEERRGSKHMAIYEFECAECGERFEVTRPIHEHDEVRNHPPNCPKCGAQASREVVPLTGYRTPSS